MEDEAVFSVLAQCFGPVDESSWNQLAGSSLWSDFLDGARRAMQDAELGVQAAPAARARKRCPLQEFLSSGEVNALFAPPTYEEKQAFAARHFTGGLPESAVPVESLYRTWSAGAAPAPFSQQQGLYLEIRHTTCASWWSGWAWRYRPRSRRAPTTWRSSSISWP